MDGPSGAQHRGHRLHANTREFGYLVAMSRTYVVAAALFVFACDADDNTYSFVIRDLRRVCMGTITPGEFHGCVTLAE